MAGLEIQIGADKTDFDKKIKEVEFDIKELSKAKLDKLKLGLDTTTINSQIKDAKNSLNTLRDSVGKTGEGFGHLGSKVGGGNNALMQFSRIAQDAPYGIIGIGNNITSTAEAFSYLKKSTGSTGGALKALASSLMGTGGILLGVSLLTTGLTLLSQSGLSVGDIIDKMTGKFDAFGQTLTKISVEAAKNSGQEIASMKALVSVAQDETKSRQERLIAVKELQSQFPAYFGNLTKEKILSGDLTGVTKELTKAIIARAEASALADKIGELASKKLELQIKQEKAILNLQKAQAGLKNKVTVTGGTMGASGLSDESRLSSATSKVKDLNQDIYDIQVQQDKLAARLNQKTEDSILLLEKKASATKVDKVFNTPNVSGIKSNIIPAPLIDVAGIAVFNGQIDSIGNKVKELPGVISTSMKFVSGSIVNPMTEEMMNTLLALDEFNKRASEIIKGALVDTFAGIGDAIGNALASGGNVMAALGVSLLDALGGLLVSMGKMAIEIGVGLLAVKIALKSMNPYVAIAAGIGLVALGAMFSSKSKSLGNSMGGGSASSSSGSGANNTSFSSGGFSSASSNGGTVVFEIAGQKLIGVLSNTLNANKRLGGQLGIG